jgi:RimJ/RimL family protein N-acetyltransferase
MHRELQFPDPPLADELVLLRGWRADDVPERLMGFADPSVQLFSWTRPTEYTEADARGFFTDQEQSRVRGEELSFAFVEPGDDAAVLGGGSVYAIDLEQRRGAVGYWLSPAARGRGVATHATRLMARWAFDVLDLARLELTCGPDNEASQRVAQRCGFAREGVLRSHMTFKGGRRDTVMHSLLPGELR